MKNIILSIILTLVVMAGCMLVFAGIWWCLMSEYFELIVVSILSVILFAIIFTIVYSEIATKKKG